MIQFSPRFGFNYDASNGKRNTQIRGGTGIMSGPPLYVWISNQIGNNGMLTGSAVDRQHHDPSLQSRPRGVRSQDR